MRSTRAVTVAGVIAASALWLPALPGCRSPLEGNTGSLRASLDRAIQQELEAIPTAVGEDGEAAEESRLETTRRESGVLAELAQRRDELEAIGPLGAGAQPAMQLGPDLTGQEQARVNITLAHAVASAIERNLSMRSARLERAISREEVMVAEAAFDLALFSSVDWTKLDQPQRVPVINGIPLGTAFTASDTRRFETGVRQPLYTGGQAFISTDVTRFRNRASGITFSPDPAYTAALTAGVNQPLLRGFGDDVSRATIRLARNARDRSAADVQREALELTADAERAYWDLVFAWRNLGIAEWLVEAGVQVRDLLAGRRELDITLAQYSDAVARIEQRRADVIRARRAVRAASDALKLLINEPGMNIASEAVLYPLDAVAEAPISYNLREAILTALDNRPELAVAALNIRDADIRRAVAWNQRLPLLDLAAQASFTGLDDNVSDAYGEAGELDFVDYILGLTFEWPLGNRAAEAQYRQARLRRTQTFINYRAAVQHVILDVKNALRDVIMNYELILATRSFRVAQAENLRTLLVEKQTLRSLTSEFLNLEFTRQETLANARQQEEQALVNFAQSLAELYRAMGVLLKMRGIEVELTAEDD